MDTPFFVYVLASRRNGTLYVGVTNNLVRRLSEHKARLVPGFTRKYKVDQLVYFEAFDSILEARAREHSLKRWRRAWKISLIENLNPDWRDLTDELRFWALWLSRTRARCGVLLLRRGAPLIRGPLLRDESVSPGSAVQR